MHQRYRKGRQTMKNARFRGRFEVIGDPERQRTTAICSRLPPL